MQKQNWTTQHFTKRYLEQMGIEKDRLRLEWISASEGKQFAHLVDEFTESIKNLGQSKVKESIETLT